MTGYTVLAWQAIAEELVATHAGTLTEAITRAHVRVDHYATQWRIDPEKLRAAVEAEARLRGVPA